MASMTDPRFSFTFTGGLLKLPSMPGMSPEWYATCQSVRQLSVRAPALKVRQQARGRFLTHEASR